MIRSLAALADVMTRDLSTLVETLQAQPTLSPDRLYDGDEPVPPRGRRLAA